MKHKNLWFLSLALLAVLFYTACSSNPEKTLLDKYFHALSMNDNQTMASIAVEPMAIEAVSFKILSVSPEIVEPFSLPDLNQAEVEAKKKMDEHVGPVVEAKDALDMAQEELDNARTSGSRAALKKKVAELQAKYDEEYNAHKELQTQYSASKEAAAQEEQVALFSLGQKSLPGIREMSGEVHSKTVQISVKTKSGAEKEYNVLMKRYILKDQTGNPNPGRWIIVKFEPVA
ncbi:MAG TPA: hypothetical protein PLB50_01675 [Candidatus Saccharicenans sp.]|nr:hypothetical protein [Candidatus Saccharicenans sp.]HQO75374.1 hypothetical protein [Candidatus Saccharicenans sp.]HUM78609.1 hypothetical protein [Candidatus Saccharicenans sp.]